MVTRIAVGDRDRGGFGLLRFTSLIGSTHGKRGRINMDLTRADAKDLTSLRRNACKQLRRVVSVEPVQSASQAIIVEIIGLDPLTKQMFNRLVGKELRHEIQ